MTKWKVHLILTIVLSLQFFLSPAFARVYFENFPKGTIDWSNGMAEAVGFGNPHGKAVNLAQGRALALHDAVALARRNLLKIVMEIRVDSASTVKDIAAKDETLVHKLRTFLRNSEVENLSYSTDGTIEATVGIKFRGPVADLLLPGSIRRIKPIQGQVPGRKIAYSKNGRGKAYTGLVVDCRGLKVHPALVPRILDEEGDTVYGSPSVSREYAIARGVAGYISKLEEARTDPRVGANPLIVQAVRASGKGSSDIVISNSDAEKIVGTASNLTFLKEGRVLFVLDAR